MSTSDTDSRGDAGTGADPSGTALLAPGRTLGQYRVVRFLGHGGMGEVYLATHGILRTRHAVKIVPQSASRDPEFVRRFHDEARIMAQLQHPRIVHVVYADQCEGIFYLAMDFVGADETDFPWDLEDALAAEPGGRFQPAAVLRLARQIGEGLRYAHGNGVVHRDLKPANVMLTSRDAMKADVKVTDFGLARLVGAQWLRDRVEQSVRASLAVPEGQDAGASREKRSSVRSLLGTYEYMSPEQKDGKEGDERSDIYAFGVILYRLLTGKRLTGRAKAASEVVEGLASAWDDIVDGCLHEEAADRYASADALLRRMEELVGGAHDAGGAGAARPLDRAVVRPEVFITHASKDKAAAERICGLLEARGVPCWIAPRNVRPGKEWAEAIVEGIEASRGLVVLLSHHANQSAAVAGELEKAFSSGIPIFPVRIENVAPSKKIELFIRRSQWVDAFAGPLEQHVERMVQSLRGTLGGSVGDQAPQAAPAVVPRRRLSLAWMAAAGAVLLAAFGGYLLSAGRHPGPAPTGGTSPAEPAAPTQPSEPAVLEPPLPPAAEKLPEQPPPKPVEAERPKPPPEPAVPPGEKPKPEQTAKPVESAGRPATVTRPPAAAKQGIAILRVRPKGAVVYVDDKQVDGEQVTLGEGTHAVRAEKSGFKKYQGTFTVKAAETCTVSIDLMPDKPAIMW